MYKISVPITNSTVNKSNCEAVLRELNLIPCKTAEDVLRHALRPVATQPKTEKATKTDEIFIFLLLFLSP